MSYEVGDLVEHSRSPGTIWQITLIVGREDATSERAEDLANMWGDYLCDLRHIYGPTPDFAARSSIFAIDDHALIDELDDPEPLLVLALASQ